MDRGLHFLRTRPGPQNWRPREAYSPRLVPSVVGNLEGPRAFPSGRPYSCLHPAKSGMGDQTNTASSDRLDHQAIPGAREPSLRVTGPDQQDRKKDRKTGQQLLGLLRRHPRLAALAAIAVVAAIIGGIMWWLQARDYESTDDAFIDARNVSVSPQVVGAITKVPVTDNELAPDRRPSGADRSPRLRGGGRRGRGPGRPGERRDRQSRRPDRSTDRPASIRRKSRWCRPRRRSPSPSRRTIAPRTLSSAAPAPQQAAQQTTSNLTQAQATVASAQANLVAAQKQIPVLEAQRASAEAQLKQMEAALQHAQDNLERTRLTAPEPGRATRISAALGALAQPGQVLMIFVPEEQMGDRKLQGDPANLHAAWAACGHRHRCLSRSRLQRTRRLDPGWQRCGVQPAAARERHRQLRQGGATGAGQDRLRHAARCVYRPRHVGGADREGAMYGAANGVTNLYQFDLLNRITNVLAGGAAAASYGFDQNGNLRAVRYGNGLTNLCQYDALNRLTNSAWYSNLLTLASNYYKLGATDYGPISPRPCSRRLRTAPMRGNTTRCPG